MNTLKKNEYIWKVYYKERIAEDEYGDFCQYFTVQEKAEKFAKKVNGTIDQACLWEDEQGKFYCIDADRVLVNLPDKKDVLAKLSDEEQRVLGLL